MNMKKCLSIPKSLYYNILFFGIGGGRLPVLFSNSTIIKGARRGAIVLGKTHRVHYGFGGSPGIEGNKHSYLLFTTPTGTIRFEGNAELAEGISICINAGEMTIGDSFACNKNCVFVSNKGIRIGHNTILGWNVSIRDLDGHPILQNGKRVNEDAEVMIGDHVWIAAHTDILKGSVIKDGCVVGGRSCVTKSSSSEPNSVLAGNPAKMIKQNIEWEVR